MARRSNSKQQSKLRRDAARTTESFVEPSAHTSSTAGLFNSSRLAIVAALVIITLIAYWPIRGNFFVYFDDPQYLTENKVVQDGLTWHGVTWAMTATAAGNWHPVTWLSHMLDIELFRLNPDGHHFMNVGLHALNSVIVFLLLVRLTGATWRCALVAALFAVHPLRVESVAWASERKDILSALFGFAAIWAYAGFVGDRRWWRYMLVMACFALSLMSKPMLVTLPALLLLLDYWPLRRFGDRSSSGWSWAALRPALLDKVPLLALSVASSAMTFVAQKGGAAVVTFDQLPLKYRHMNAVVSYANYLGKTFWPFDLALLYPYAKVFDAAAVFGCAVLLLVITVLAIMFRRRLPHFIVGWLWFLGTLVPVIGLVQVGLQSMADRYAYVPQVGLLIALAWGLSALVTRFKSQRLTQVLATACAVIIVALVLRTQSQVRVWRDSVTLFTHATAVTEGNWHMHNAVGAYLDWQGKLDEALLHFEAAARINPANEDVQFNLGNALARKGQIQRAMAAYSAAIQTNPAKLEALNDLAWLLATQPDERFRNGKTSLDLAQRACSIANNTHAESLDTLAVAFAETGDMARAIATARAAREMASTQQLSLLVVEIDRHLAAFTSGQPVRSSQLRAKDAVARSL